jgi:hypothetical protein
MKMNIKQAILIGIVILSCISCNQTIEKEITDYSYYDQRKTDIANADTLFAISNEEYLEYGANVAFLNAKGDTIIPFGKYAYFGTDTLAHFAFVMEHPNDSTYGRCIAINQNQKILFDIVIFDCGPDYFNEGLTRVMRNGKMGFANQFGEIIIPCKYDYAKVFYNGTAEVTFDAKEYFDMDEHLIVTSNEWFSIDQTGNKISQTP